MIKVLCYIPVHRTIEAIHALALLELQKYEIARGEVDLTINFLVGESFIPRARNTIVDKFMKTDNEYLLMIDSDLVFKRETLQTLLSHDVDLVGGNYVHKTGVKKWAGKPDDFDLSLSPASFIPTGMMLIKKSVFERLTDQPSIPTYKTSDSKKVYGYFNCFVKDDIYLSEDWSFSKRCERAGIKGFIDNDIQLAHVGTKLYVGY